MTDFEQDWTAFVDEHGGLGEAAAVAGITYDAMRLRRSKQRRRAERGELGYGLGLPGFATKSIAGKIDGKFVKQVRAAGDKYELPAGQRIKGVSALVDADGREVAKWIKSDRDLAVAAFSVDAIKEALSSITPRLPIARPMPCYADLLTDYIVGDHHLGLLAWKPEAGVSFDTKIGEKLLIDKMDELVERTPPSKTAIFTNLGDFFHSNNDRNRTEQSGVVLDVDGRYGKVLQVGLKLAIACIERLLTKHEIVIVAWLRGNHDPEIAMAAALALWAWFRNEPRVEIEFNPSKFFVHQHGKTMIFKTHGDALKPTGVVDFVASYYRKMWGDCTNVYAHFGHVHHKTSDTRGSLVWESFESLAAKDSWHAGRGYMSGRSMTAITYHNVTGEWSRNRVSVA